MDFASKKHLYKKEKFNLPRIIKKNKNIFFGSGGSDNITIVHNDIAIKVIPEFNKHPICSKFNQDQKEIEHYILFTKDFILKNITPHIVGYYSHYKLYDIDPLFPKKCMNQNDMLLIDPKKLDKTLDKLCYLKKLRNNDTLSYKADILILEKCSDTIEKEIKNILNLQNKDKYVILSNFIHRTIFQFMYTMACIQKKYPKFIHNDMFLRNILGVNETEFSDNDYVEYIYNNKSYYLPANGFYLKINDFGTSLNPPKIVSTLLDDIKFDPSRSMAIDDPKRDIYTFLYDYYNGQNLGHSSVMKLINNKSNNTKKYIRKQFAKYIDVTIIDKIHKHNERLLNRTWNIKDIKILQDSVKLPNSYFKNDIFKKYEYINDEYNIVKTFSL